MIIRPQKKWIAGVCAGIANHFQVPIWVVRGAWALSVCTVIPFFFYFICALSLPREGSESSFFKPKVLGVCYKISKNTGMDLSVLRIGTLSLAWMSFGVVFLIYVLMWFVYRPVIQN